MHKTACSLVEQALRDCRQAKNATTRGEVAKYFLPEEACSFELRPGTSTPGVNTCMSMLGFEPGKPSEIASLPDDKGQHQASARGFN